MNGIVVTLYGIIKSMGLCGLDSIRYMVFIITMINSIFNLSKTEYYDKVINLDGDTDVIKAFVNKFQNDAITQYDIFNFKINEILYEILFTLKNKIIVENKQNIDFKTDTIANIFKYHFNNDTLLMIKEYYKFYIDSLLVEWIINLSKVAITRDKVETVLDGNVKVNSFMEAVVEKGIKNGIDWAQNKDKIVGIQNNSIIYDFSKLNILTRSDFKIDNIFKTDVLSNDLPTPTKRYDVIFYDFPSDVRNITHASCCSKVKNLKIRGTKYEPLLLQLIMTSLNQQGRAYIIVPDSLLYNDAIQHVETRKYLINNFNIRKIISVDESFYRLKGNKHSIIWFENTGKTTSINFSKLELNNNRVEEIDIITIPVVKLENNVYSLYHKIYLDMLNYNKEINYTTFSDKFTLESETDFRSQSIGIDKYYKNDNSIKKLSVGNPSNDTFDYYIVSKDNNDFAVNFLEYTIRTKYEQLIKGKMNQIDLDKIRNIRIPILDHVKQESINNYIKITCNVISDNFNGISMNNKLKTNLLNTIPTNNLQVLENVCQVIQTTDPVDRRLIGIVKNGLTAGSVYFLQNKQLPSSNSYYLESKDSNVLTDYIYYYLKHIEDQIKEKAGLNAQPLVNKTTLLSLKIPIINIDNQKEIVEYCSDFDNNINRFVQANTKIKEKDVMGTVIKLYNL